MMKKIHIILTLGFLFLMTSVFGQMKLRVADRLYDELVYYKAVDIYKDLADKKTPSAHAVRRTAECYRLLNKPAESVEYYKKLMKTTSDIKADDYYNYAQMLKGVKKYEDASEMIKKYSELAGADSKKDPIVKQLQDPNYAEKLTSDAYTNKFKIKKLSEINTENKEFSPMFYNKGQSIVFASSRRNLALNGKKNSWDGDNFLDVYEANLSTKNDVEDVKKVLPDYKTKYNDGPACFNADETEIFITRNAINAKNKSEKGKDNIVNLKIYIGKRKDNKSEWEKEMTPFQHNSSEYSVGHPTLSKDGKKLYFVSNMPGGMGEEDIYVCERQGDGSWSAPKNLGPDINTKGRDMFPFISDRGMLFFATDGRVGLGGLDVFYAAPKRGGGFREAKNVGAKINSNYDDFGFIADKDEKLGFFTSNRKGGAGDDDIYRVQILEPFNFVLKGHVVDNADGSILPNSKVQLVASNGDVLEAIETEDGSYSFLVEKGETYKIKGEKQDYLDKTISLDIKEAENGIVNQNLELVKEEYDLAGKVIGTVSKKPVEGLKVKITDNKTGRVIGEYTTDGNGKFTDELKDAKRGDRLDWTITAEKKQIKRGDETITYVPTSVNFKTTLDQPGTVDVSGEIANLVQEVVKGKPIQIDINPIYFEFGKANITPQAAAELDKVIAFMKQYPQLELELGSHTDYRGSSSANRRLSDRRAKASAKYILENGGFDKKRIKGRGYGEDIPTTENGEKLTERYIRKFERKDKKEFERLNQLNRRTEFKVLGIR